MTPEELRALIQYAGDTRGDPARFGTRSALKTDDCPARSLYYRDRSEWSATQIAHAEGCRYCRIQMAHASAGASGYWAAVDRDRTTTHEATAPSASTIPRRGTPWRIPWALQTAAALVIGSVLTAAVMRQMQPREQDFSALSESLTAAPTMTLQEIGRRGGEDSGTPVQEVSFSTGDPFVRIVVHVPTDERIDAVQFFLRRGAKVVWRTQSPVTYVAGVGLATAIVPTSLLSPGEIHFAYSALGAATVNEWRLEPSMRKP